MSVLRTPDACFDNLPLWDYEPQYFTSTLRSGLKTRLGSALSRDGDHSPSFPRKRESSGRGRDTRDGTHNFQTAS